MNTHFSRHKRDFIKLLGAEVLLKAAYFSLYLYILKYIFRLWDICLRRYENFI